MKYIRKQIRNGVFETNSSSTHTITICSEQEFEKWKNGEMIYDAWDECLIPVEECKRDRPNYTYDKFSRCDFTTYETFEEKYITPNGEVVYAFGYYGYY